MSAARLNSRALTVRGTLPQIGSFSLALSLLSASAAPTPRLSVAAARSIIFIVSLRFSARVNE